MFDESRNKNKDESKNGSSAANEPTSSFPVEFPIVEEEGHSNDIVLSSFHSSFLSNLTGDLCVGSEVVVRSEDSYTFSNIRTEKARNTSDQEIVSNNKRKTTIFQDDEVLKLPRVEILNDETSNTNDDRDFVLNDSSEEDEEQSLNGQSYLGNNNESNLSQGVIEDSDLDDPDFVVSSESSGEEEYQNVARKNYLKANNAVNTAQGNVIEGIVGGLNADEGNGENNPPNDPRVTKSRKNKNKDNWKR